MTRLELMRTGSLAEIAKMLCDATDDILAEDGDTCKHCIAAGLCKMHHNGFADWLTKEVDNAKDTDI